MEKRAADCAEGRNDAYARSDSDPDGNAYPDPDPDTDSCADGNA